MAFKLEQLEYQEKAIQSVVDVFKGQEKNTFDNACHYGVRSNIGTLSQEEIQENIKEVIHGMVFLKRWPKSNFSRVEFKPDPKKSEKENVEALKEYINEKESSMQTMFNKEDIVDEVLLKNGFMLDYSLEEQEAFKENKIYLAKDDHREALICLDGELHENTVEHFNGNDDMKFICLERALNTSKKWNLKNYLGDKLNAM